MAPTRAVDTSTRLSKRTLPTNNSRLSVGNAPIKLDKALLAKKSARIASLLEENRHDDLAAFFQHIKADPETIELIARFCHGLEVRMTSENIIPLICLTYHLQMTESHSPNNLQSKAVDFLEQKILRNWDEMIRTLRALSSQAFEQAIEIGLIEHIFSALATQAMSYPSLLGDPTNLDPNSKPLHARRKLFDPDHSVTPVEDLTSLPLQIYEPVITAMVQWRVPQENIVTSLCRYLQNHPTDRDVIEAAERLLPSSSMTIDQLFEIYSLAVSLSASSECLTGLENRIGKQLDRATVKDLLVLDLGVESLRQILKGYYGNYNDPTPTGLVAVAELMEKYLIEIAKVKELEVKTFVEVAEMVKSTSCVGSYRSSDGIYRTVDVYLDAHRELTELEKEEVCNVLDFNKLSKQACEHATQNQRMPLRMVVQALFVSQLQLRDDISRAVGQSGNNSSKAEEEYGGDDKDEIKLLEDDERREISDRCHQKNCCAKSGKKKVSLWKEMKRKLGCMNSTTAYEALQDCDCQTKKRRKVNPKLLLP